MTDNTTPHEASTEAPGQTHHLPLLQQCATCERWFTGPRVSCPQGGDHELRHSEVSGRGTVFSWTVTHVPMSAWASGRTPYMTALVELAEGLRLLAHYEGTEADIDFGQPVHLVQVDGEGEWPDGALLASRTPRAVEPRGVDHE